MITTITWAALCFAFLIVGYMVGKDYGQRTIFEEYRDLIDIVQETQKEEAELIVELHNILSAGKKQ